MNTIQALETGQRTLARENIYHYGNRSFRLGNDGLVYASTPDKQMVSLNNSLVFYPESVAGAQNHQHDEFLRRIYGNNYRDTVKDKVVVVPYIFAGWGHLFQAFSQAMELAQAGVKTVLVDVEELVHPEDSRMLKLHQRLLSSWHHGTQLSVSEMIRTDQGIRTVLSDLQAAMIVELSDSQYRYATGNVQNKPLDKAVSLIASLRRISPSLDSWVVRRAVDVDTKTSAKPFQKGIVNFLDSIKADAVLTTHSLPARALKGTDYEQKTILAIPDPGYAVDQNMMVPFVASSKILYGVADNDETHLTKKSSGQLLTTKFGIPPDHIFSVGTIGAQVQEQLIREQWANSDHERMVMISTSGNASHLKYLKKAVTDFSETLLRGRGSPYKLVVFIGEHKGEEVDDIINEISKHPQIVTKNGDPKQNCIVVRTHNLIETAHMKNFYKSMCLVEIAKPGENPLDAPQVGSFFIGLKAGAHNEVINLKHVVKNWDSALPSAWPPDSYAYWRKNGFDADAHYGFNQGWNNLFEYLDFMFGKNWQNRNIAYEKALNGLMRSKRNAGLYLAAMAMGVAIDTSATRLHGPSAIDNRIRLQQLMDRNDQLTTELEELKQYLGPKWIETDTLENKRRLQQILLNLSGFSSKEEFMQEIAPQTALVTFLAGSSTRWKDSLKTQRGEENAKLLKIDPELPRSLTRLPNFLEGVPGDSIPIGAYALWAAKGLGQQIVVYDHEQHRKMFEEQIVAPLNIQATYFQQQYDGNKPYGTGDALLQMKSLLRERGYKYVITNNGSDANSPDTMYTALLAMHVLEKYGESDLAAIIPVSYMAGNPNYPIVMEQKSGKVIHMGHKKLYGEESVGLSVPAPSNVGIRVYRTEHLLPVLDELEAEYIQAVTDKRGSRMQRNYAQLPDHGNIVNELAVDDIDRAIFTAHTKLLISNAIRILNIADPREINWSAKEVDKLGLFLHTMYYIVSDAHALSDRFRSVNSKAYETYYTLLKELGGGLPMGTS